MKLRYELRNHHTGEVIDCGQELSDAVNKAIEVSGVKEWYYVRHNTMEDGTVWMDFGSYEWFIYEIHG